MKDLFKISFIVAGSLTLFAACIDDRVPAADAAFTIEVDAIVKGVKTRLAVDTVNVSDSIYFVAQSSSTYNSIWPGDTLGTGKTVIYQNYDSMIDSVTIKSIKTKLDTSFQQSAIKFQGVALPYGSKYKKYAYKSKGKFTVTWIARNTDGTTINQAILQKKIVVK